MVMCRDLFIEISRNVFLVIVSYQVANHTAEAVLAQICYPFFGYLLATLKPRNTGC